MRHRSTWLWPTMLRLIGFAVFVCPLPLHAVAQTTVSSMRIDWGGWSFKPIIDADSPAARVTGFLALSKEENTIGENIVAVWYIRHADRSWSKKSWLTNDIGEAIRHVKISTGIPDSDDAKWEVARDLRLPPSDDPESPKNYDKGLLECDPLYPLVSTSSDAESIVSFLADVGYKAARIAIDYPTSVTTDEQLDVMAIAIEAGHSIVVHDQQSAFAQTEAMASIIATTSATQPGTACVPGITGPWTLGAIVGPSGCAWSVTDSWVAVTGGRSYTCTYEWCCTYTRVRSAPAVRADCSTYTCSQIEIQRVCAAPIVCTSFVPTPTPPDQWASPCGLSPLCSTAPPVPPGPPTTWTWPNSTNCP